VTFFQQGDLPCFSEAGAILMKSRSEVATAPDGNGGVYQALHANGCVADMQKRGVKHVYAYCVDNAAVKVGDPTFVGFCVSKACDAGAKVIQKAYPTEPVGVFTRRDGKVHVVEYSEMPEALATARLEPLEPSSGERGEKKEGALKFDAANIVLHYYSMAFLASCCDPDGEVQRTLAYHVARKKIPVVSGDGLVPGVTPTEPNGVKLEAFIFDVYAFAETVAFLNGDRASDFAPVKNKEGAGKDSPDTARALLSNLHRTWIERNGGVVVGDGPIEVAPAVSYDGARGLEFAKGRAFAANQAVEEDVWVEARDARETRDREIEPAPETEEGASKRAKTK
jgi:UDP-N-acetylglucosamine/UDP-N-acetylgalactosamine diphosphorylase